MSRHQANNNAGWTNLAGLLLLAGLGLVLAGCTAAHYRRQADKETYKIIQQVEQQVFGKTNKNFTIDTRFSNRKPEEISPSELIDDRDRDGRRALPLDEALQLAVRESRSYQNQKEQLYLTALTLTGARYNFGPKFFARSSGTLTRTGSGDLEGRAGSEIGVNQLLKSGGSLGVTLANDLLRFFSGDNRREVVNLVSVNLKQPLLRGFGRNSPEVENLTQAERNVVYAVRDFAYYQNSFALQVVNDYFQLLAQKENIRNRYTNYLSRIDATKRLEERANDRERQLDVDQARQAELSAKNNYINAVAQYQNTLDSFKLNTLGIPLGDRLALDDSALHAVAETGLVPVPMDTDAVYRLAVQRHMQVLNAIDRFEDAKRKIRIRAEAFKPDIFIDGDASLESDRPTDYTRFNANDVRADIGLGLDIPINPVPGRNTYRSTLVSFEVELRNLTLRLDELKDDVERGLRTLEQRRQNFQIQSNALILANRRVDSATVLLEAGRAEVRDLVEAQDAQIQAQNALTAALVDYQNARLQLMLDIGAINTEIPQFWLKDHMTAYMAGKDAALRPASSPDEPVSPPDTYFNQ